MSDVKESNEKKKPLRLKRPGRLELRKTVETGQVRQSFSHGRSKAVTVEVRRKRTFAPGEGDSMTEVKARRQAAAEKAAATPPAEPAAPAPETDEKAGEDRQPIVLRTLTDEEKEARARALEEAQARDVEARQRAAEEAKRRAEEEARLASEREAAAQRAAEEEERKRQEEEARRRAEEEATRRLAEPGEEGEAAAETPARGGAATARPETPEQRPRRGKGERRSALAPRRDEPRRRTGKMTISQALVQEDRTRSLASVRRAREREKRAQRQKQTQEPTKVVREVVLPDTITVQELANRMAVRGADVVKALMNMGSMATITQSIDADTAELLIHEFGHRVKRVSESDVEIGLKGAADAEEALKPRPPVVTVMGHVDHGKTSLLDALRRTDVVGGEAGGITQHIGAYQVTVESGAKITFIDTPGHEAFTSMRARGARVTDIVVLVVAADDGVMPQTVEAINHAKAAEVPIVVAINKIDRPDADPDRVRNDLLQHEIVVEERGGEVLTVEVSATEGTNLDKLAEAIALQAELLDLKANPDRPAEGVVVEAKLDRGRGPVATVLVQRGTLNVGDIVVAGGEWARIRALVDDRGEKVDAAGPSMAVEILGLTGVPEAGDEMVVVDSERRAREVTEYRQTQMRDVRAAEGARGTLEQMFADIAEGKVETLPVVIKGDVQGSVEAITASLEKLNTEEVAIQVLHAGVGGINESDVTLAKASNAAIIGFNVRANAQARELARRENVDIRYYSVIYELIDDLKTALSGLLAPATREKIVGNAQVLEVFDITKIGRVAGCRVTDGVIRRGARVRLLRDDVVIHEGRLATLKRFKDDVREVKEGLECGMSFENYQDIREGDMIEAYEVEEVARTL